MAQVYHCNEEEAPNDAEEAPRASKEVFNPVISEITHSYGNFPRPETARHLSFA